MAATTAETGGVVEGDPREHVEGDQHLAEPLSQEVPHGHPENGVHRRLGEEEHGDVDGSQADRGVDADFAEALVHGAEHGVEDDHRRDHRRYRQGSQPLDRGQTDGAVAVHGDAAFVVGDSGVHEGGDAQQVLLDELDRP